MPLLNRVLIAADLSGMDDQLFEFSQQLIAEAGAYKVYAMHIIPDFSKPDQAVLDFYKRFTIGSPIDEKAKDLLKNQAQQYFGDMDVEVAVEVIEGKPYEKLLHMAEVKEISLVIAGVKANSDHSGITARRLARNLECDLLLVPELGKQNIEKLVVAIDFSDNSARALLFALQLRKALDEQLPIELLYITHLLPMANYYGLSESGEYRDLMKKGAEKHCKEFLKKYNLGKERLELKVVNDDLRSTSSQIHDYIRKTPGTMLVMGAQGHSLVGRLLFGSVTESLVNKVKDVPVLIIR